MCDRVQPAASPGQPETTSLPHLLYVDFVVFYSDLIVEYLIVFTTMRMLVMTETWRIYFSEIVPPAAAAWKTD